jgi:hypothetical protein
MKRFIAVTIMLAVASLFTGCTGISSKTDTMNYKVFADGPAKLDIKGSIEISGTGYEPGTNIVLIFNSADGIKSDLSGSLKPVPVADASGNWATTWSYGHMVKKKIIKAGSYKIDAMSNEYETLATTSLTFTK